MPFVASLRQRLTDLKTELENGLLPPSLYEDMCRKAIDSYGNDAFETVPAAVVEARPPRKQRRRTRDPSSPKLICPLCDKELVNTQGLSTHLLARHKRSIEEYEIDFTTGILTLRGTQGASKNGSIASDSGGLDRGGTGMLVSILSDVVLSDETAAGGANEDKFDRRKFNRGQSQRKSYTKEHKLQVIALRDEGRSIDEIALIMNTSRVNVEKWSTGKVREDLVREATETYHSKWKDQGLRHQKQMEAILFPRRSGNSSPSGMASNGDHPTGHPPSHFSQLGVPQQIRVEGSTNVDTSDSSIDAYNNFNNHEEREVVCCDFNADGELQCQTSCGVSSGLPLEEDGCTKLLDPVDDCPLRNDKMLFIGDLSTQASERGDIRTFNTSPISAVSAGMGCSTAECLEAVEKCAGNSECANVVATGCPKLSKGEKKDCKKLMALLMANDGEIVSFDDDVVDAKVTEVNSNVKVLRYKEDEKSDLFGADTESIHTHCSHASGSVGSKTYTSGDSHSDQVPSEESYHYRPTPTTRASNSQATTMLYDVATSLAVNDPLLSSSFSANPGNGFDPRLVEGFDYSASMTTSAETLLNLKTPQVAIGGDGHPRNPESLDQEPSQRKRKHPMRSANALHSGNALRPPDPPRYPPPIYPSNDSSITQAYGDDIEFPNSSSYSINDFANLSMLASSAAFPVITDGIPRNDMESDICNPYTTGGYSNEFPRYYPAGARSQSYRGSGSVHDITTAPHQFFSFFDPSMNAGMASLSVARESRPPLVPAYSIGDHSSQQRNSSGKRREVVESGDILSSKSAAVPSKSASTFSSTGDRANPNTTNMELLANTAHSEISSSLNKRSLNGAV